MTGSLLQIANSPYCLPFLHFFQPQFAESCISPLFFCCSAGGAETLYPILQVGGTPSTHGTRMDSLIMMLVWRLDTPSVCFS